MSDFLLQLPFAVTISDSDGKILYMNEKSTQTFQAYGGENLIGASLFDCHPKDASDKLRDMLKGHYTNAYTIEKNGIKKLIYQSPWFSNGLFAGYIELSLPLPEIMPHFKRNA